MNSNTHNKTENDMNKTIGIGQKLFRSGISGLVALAVMTTAGFIVMPYVIHYLGDRTYGVWVLIGTLLGYFGMLDIGLSRAVMRFVSQALGKNDRAEADRWINAGFFIFLLLALLGIGLSFIVWFVVGRTVSDPSESEILRRACFIATFAFSISLPSRCFQGILSAHVRQDIINYIQMGIAVFRSAGILVAVYFGGSFILLVMIAAFATLLSSSIVVFMAFRVHGQIHIGIHFLREVDYRKFVRYAMSTFASQIADILRFKTAPFIIASILGIAAVTPFAIAERICNLARNVCTTVLDNLTPGFSNFEGSGGVEGNILLRRAYFFAYKISCYIGVFVIGMALILSRVFIIRWMGHEYTSLCNIANIMLMGVAFAIIQIPTVCLLFSISKQTFYAFSNWLQAIMTVVLAIVLIFPFGLYGVAIAIASMTFLVKLFIQPFGASSVFGMSIMRYHVCHTLPNISLPILFIGAFYYTSRGFIVPNYGNIFIVASIATALFCPVVFFFGFNKGEQGFITKCILPARCRRGEISQQTMRK